MNGPLAIKVSLSQVVHWSMQAHLLKNKAFGIPAFHRTFLLPAPAHTLFWEDSPRPCGTVFFFINPPNFHEIN